MKIVTPFVAVLCGMTAASVSCAARAESDEQVSIVEPVNIEEVTPTKAGEFDLRLGTVFVRSRDDAETDRLDQRAQIFYGISSGFSAEITVPYVVHMGATESRAGLGAIAVGAKLRVTPERAVPLVVRFEASTPASDEAFGETHPEFEASLGSVWRGRRATLQGGLGGYTNPEAHERGVFAQGSLARSFGVACTGFAECIVERSLIEHTNSLRAGPALQLALGEEAYVAAGALVGFTDGADRVSARVHVQRGF